MKQQGFVLVTAVLVIFLMLASLNYVLLKTTSHIKTTQFTKTQMKSMLLAENGLAAARRIIAEKEINEILVGLDGTGSLLQENNPLNPLDPAEARSVDISSWENKNDDGFYRFSPASGQNVLIKISNNDAEPPFVDQDGEVRVRSLGTVKNGLLESELPGIKNQVTLLEGIYRKENAFTLPSPLVCYDPQGRWDFEGNEFQIRGGEESSVLLLGDLALAQSEVLNIFARELPPECRDSTIPFALSGEGMAGYPNLVYLSSPQFWNHFRKNIGRFGADLSVEGDAPSFSGMLKFSGDTPMKGSYSGILVTSGDITLTGNFLMEGILLHLGGGKLNFRQHSSVRGAVLYIADESEGGSSLKIEDQSRIIYSRSAIETARKYLPVTHLGTRIIYE